MESGSIVEMSSSAGVRASSGSVGQRCFPPLVFVPPSSSRLIACCIASLLTLAWSFESHCTRPSTYCQIKSHSRWVHAYKASLCHLHRTAHLRRGPRTHYRERRGRLVLHQQGSRAMEAGDVRPPRARACAMSRYYAELSCAVGSLVSLLSCGASRQGRECTNLALIVSLL